MTAAAVSGRGQPNPPNASATGVKTDTGLQLQVAATERAWVAVDADGKTAFQRVLNPQEVETVKARESFDVTTGNAQGVILTLNGETLKPVGRRGEVKSVHITRDDLKILPPRSAISERMVDLIRFGKAPEVVRRRGAEGDLPVPADERIEILILLSAAPEPDIRNKALETLKGRAPLEVRQAMASPLTAPDVLAYAAENLVPVRGTEGNPAMESQPSGR